MEHLRLGYIGCGFMAQHVHLPNFSSLPTCDHQELLADPEIEAVALSAAFHVQGDLAREALEAGKDVFMEKPMAISLGQADAILDAERRSGKRLMVGYMKRYDAGNELVHSLIAESAATGELGDMTYLRNHGFGGNWLVGLEGSMETTSEPMPSTPVIGPDWLPPEWLDAYVGYLQQFTHNINLLRYFANAGDDVSVRTVDLDDDGYGGVVVLDLGGVRGILESGRISHHRWDEHTQVYFSDGWIHTWAPPLMQRQAAAGVEIYRAGKIQAFSRPVVSPSWAYRREAEQFVHDVQHGTPFRSSASDTRTDVRLFEEIYRRFLTQRGEL